MALPGPLVVPFPEGPLTAPSSLHVEGQDPRSSDDRQMGSTGLIERRLNWVSST